MISLKSVAEIGSIREACQVAAEVLKELEELVKPGISAIELDREGEKAIRKRGALPAFKGYRGYKHATCISRNFEVVHGIPDDRKLKEGDIVSVDVGTKVGKFFGDTAATFAVGRIDKRLEKLIRAAKEALYLGIAEAKPGKYLGDVSFAIQSHAEKNGYTVVRDLFGHGIGTELHEDPLVPNFGQKGTGPRLEEGMVFAIEPMLNMGRSDIETLSDGWTVVTRDRKFSAHFEHTVAVTKKGTQVLTEIK